MALPPKSRHCRRRRRGAAMVEAVVAIPFFILIFSGMIFVSQLYGEKQRTLREAKQAAWTHALGSCEGNGASTVGESNPVGDLAAQGSGSTDASLGKYASSAGGAEMMRDWGTASVTVKGSVTADPILGGFTVDDSLTTTTKMQCNEKAHEGNVLGVLKFGWDLFKFW